MGKWKGHTILKIIPDENLSKIIGKESITTSEMVKKLWVYIKKNCKMEKVKI